MAVLKVEVTSRDMIKPSTPKSHHLKTHQLSFLDQFAPPIYIPLIFFYPTDPSHPNDHIERSICLKKSLSETLIHFFPLAGRIEGNNSIDCNDEGVEYCEANVSNNLLEVIDNPNLQDLRMLLPFQPISNKNIVLGVQVNHFSCGGIAISVCISHKIADGTALVTFVNTWATTTREIDTKNNHATNTIFDLTSYFPPRDFSRMYTPGAGISEEKIVTKRFIFDKKKLDALKEQAANFVDNESQVKSPTRVEVVTAFIWKRFIEAARVNPNSLAKISAALHAVNLRTRMMPSIPEDCFGNIWWFTIAPLSIGEEAKYPELVAKLRQAIRKIDDNYIKKLQNGECLLEMKEAYEKLSYGVVEFCNFSSWCRFPLYEVDFGWGKPIWACTTTLPFKNLVVLLSTKCGEGIEAWVNMLEDDISTLQQDLELLSIGA